MEQGMVPQLDASYPTTNPDAAAMALTGNTMADLANVAKELGVTLGPDGNPVEAPAQSAPVPAAQDPVQNIVTEQETPAPAAQQTAEQPTEPVKVPAKFQNEDGSPNVEKIAKAEQNIDAMIERYKAKEREAQQLQNRVNNPPLAQPVQTVQPIAPVPVAPQPLELQVANDILTETQALINQGYQPAQAQALATARVQVKLQEARYQAEVSATADLRRQVEDTRRTQELKDMVEKDPALLSPEMVDTLWQVRQANPWLNNAPEPWKAALHFYRGSQGHAQPVTTPNPTGQTAKAPPTPVRPVARVQPAADLSKPQNLTDDQLVAEIRKVYPGFRNK